MANNGTHHQVGEAPLYEARFFEVLAFHEPGLAPARDASGAFHIDGAGMPAYAPRYLRTFGFYEGIAAVQANDGWHHVLPDGAPFYPERYAWSGNYQGGRCSVRALDGRYLHLDEHGAPAYAQRWRYTGDYREGAAVVQREDGLHTHIDRRGNATHGRWFDDLDVFHKGFARARLDDGWAHVDRTGAPAYRRRFALIEPFYNGQARVERFDGTLAIIDERGESILELRSQSPLFAPVAAHPSAPRPLPEGLLATLHVLLAAGPGVLLIRHADRRPLAPGVEDGDAEISDEGSARAEDLGRRLRSRAGLWAETSPLVRCQQTVQHILAGAAKSADIAHNRLLGDPGPFVVDPRGGSDLFASLGTPTVVRGQIAGETWPPLHPTAEGAFASSSVTSPGAFRERGGTGICVVSHDAMVMPVIAALTGEQFVETWLEPLDGLALLLGSLRL